MAHATISPEVEQVLRASKVEGNLLFLPPKQLERSLYDGVNKVLINCGGKWNKGKKAHVFDGDPMTKLGLALETGTARDVKKDTQAYYTPPALARRVVQLASVAGKTVLEPSCGTGALIRACLEAGAEGVTGFETDEYAVAVCDKSVSLQKNVMVFKQDFLTTQYPVIGVDRICMNPPFAKNQDVKHVAHAWKFLKPGGRLVAIMWPNTKRAAFEALLDAGDVAEFQIIQVDAGEFKESGTDTASLILILDKKST